MSRITDYTSLAAPASNDVLPIVDVSDTTMSAAGTTKQATAASLAPAVLPTTTLGDLIYENATPAPARLAGNTSSTKNFLTQTGNGTISAAPAWGTVAAADLPAATTSTQGAVVLDGTSGDIQALGSQAAGNSAKAAAANHVHPLTGLVTSVTAADASVVVAGTSAAPTIAAQLSRPQAARYAGVSGQTPRESIPFYCATGAIGPGSGQMVLAVLPVTPGDVITNVGFVSGSTAATFGSSGYHWWVAIYSTSTLGLIAQSADKTNTAIAANTAYMLALGSPAPYTVPSNTYSLYAALMVNTGTGGSPAQPTVRGPSFNTPTFDSATSLFPTSLVYAATSGSGLGASAPAGPVTLTATGACVYFGAD